MIERHCLLCCLKTYYTAGFLILWNKKNIKLSIISTFSSTFKISDIKECQCRFNILTAIPKLNSLSHSWTPEVIHHITSANTLSSLLLYASLWVSSHMDLLLSFPSPQSFTLGGNTARSWHCNKAKGIPLWLRPAQLVPHRSPIIWSPSLSLTDKDLDPVLRIISSWAPKSTCESLSAKYCYCFLHMANLKRDGREYVGLLFG